MLGKMILNILVSLAFVSLAVAQDQILAPPAAQKLMIRNYEQLAYGAAAKVSFLNLEQRKKLLKLVSENEVASLGSISLYDPPQNGSEKGEIGYCYGRAMAAHLIARKMGLTENSVLKIFAAGDMQNGSTRWRFHVATVVKGEDGKAYAVDPIMPRIVRRHNAEAGTQIDPDSPLLLSQWIAMVRKTYDNTKAILEKNPGLIQNPKFTGSIQFYMTSTEAIMVDMREIPANLELENGERIIELLFDPIHKSGFKPMYVTGKPQEGGHPDYFLVQSPEVLRRYFMVLDEPLKDQFNFFKLDADIFYLDAGFSKTLTRHYLYNGKVNGATEFQSYDKGYFPSLLNSIFKMSEGF